jgi:hypothetical protein
LIKHNKDFDLFVTPNRNHLPPPAVSSRRSPPKRRPRCRRGCP